MKKIMVFSLMILNLILGAATFAMAEDAAVLKSQKTVSVLNDLIEINLDGEKGFREAAEHVASVSFKEHFMARSAEYAAFAAELKGKVLELGQGNEQNGSLVEAARRTWLNMKVSVTESDDKAVLEVVKSQQARAIAEYRSALRGVLTEDIRDILNRQNEKMQDCFDWITDHLNGEVAEEKQDSQ